MPKKPFKIPNVLSWGFVTANPLTARVQIARDKNHHCPSSGFLEPTAGCCQTNANWSLQGQRGCPLCRAEIAPLSESGGAVELEVIA